VSRPGAAVDRRPAAATVDDARGPLGRARLGRPSVRPWTAWSRIVPAAPGRRPSLTPLWPHFTLSCLGVPYTMSRKSRQNVFSTNVKQN